MLKAKANVVIASTIAVLMTFAAWQVAYYMDGQFLSTKFPHIWNRQISVSNSIDPAIIEEIRDLFDPPSVLPYNLTNPNRVDFSQHGQSQLYIELFKFKRFGTFLEAGAWDGEGLSNSLMLERKYGWTGLLIEPSPSNYDIMMRKHRRSTHLHACIGDDPTQSQSLTLQTYQGRLSVLSRIAGHGLPPLNRGEGPTRVTIKCFPLTAILKAANIYQLDLLMLDLEGFEINVIKSLDWAAFDISVVSLECAGCIDLDGKNITIDPAKIAKRNLLKQFMVSVGYAEKLFVPRLDIIYVRNDVALDGELLDLDVGKLRNWTI